MTCPFLKDTLVPVCTVHSGTYLPSTFELEEYCRNDKAKICPYPSLMLFGIGHTAWSKAGREALSKAA